jgi:protein phosphatase 2C family protein 2/3
MAESN